MESKESITSEYCKEILNKHNISFCSVQKL